MAPSGPHGSSRASLGAPAGNPHRHAHRGDHRRLRTARAPRPPALRPGHGLAAAAGVAVADPGVDQVLDGDPLRSTVVHHPTTPAGLPLARARNLGAAAALSAGADLLVFLDVDCIPGRRMLERYVAAATTDRHLLCGPVAYLPPRPAGGYQAEVLEQQAEPHPARPAPPDGTTIESDEHTLFWSLSFAVTAPLWSAIGGFCEEYIGYGAEDTDFGQVAGAGDIGIRWVGGASAFHQFHPVSDPPTEHLVDILRNSTIFHRRWGWWPMGGWLGEFARRGLISYDAGNHTWQRHERAGAAPAPAWEDGWACHRSGSTRV